MNNGKIHENDYYVGIDFGYHTVSIGYLDRKANKPILMDRSGGYGKAYSPSIMKYSMDEQEWLIGDDVVEDFDSKYHDSQIISRLLEGLEGRKTIQINEKVYDYDNLIGLYIDVLLSHLKYLNPKSQVKGLCVTLPDALYNVEGSQLESTLKKALKSKVLGLISVIPNTSCIIQYLKTMDLIEKEDCFLMDFGHNNLRIYHMVHSKPTRVDPYMTIEDLSGEFILKGIHQLIFSAYCDKKGVTNLNAAEKQLIEKMTMTYLPYFFKSYREESGLKVTFNTVYPPFQSMISKEVIFQTIEPHRVNFEEVLMSLKTDYPEAEVIMTGNGFHMGWPMIQLEAMSFDIMVEDVDGIVKGAALHSYWPMETKSLVYGGLLSKDYGVMIEDNNQSVFCSLKKRGTHYTQKSEPVGLVLRHSEEQILRIYTKDENQQLEEVGQWSLEPESEEGIYRIVVTLTFPDETRVEPIIQYDLL